MSVSATSATLRPCSAHSPTFCTSGTYDAQIRIVVERDRYNDDIALSVLPQPSSVTAYFGPSVIAGPDIKLGEGVVPNQTTLYLSVFTFGFPFPAGGYGVQQFVIRGQGADGVVRTVPFTLTITP